jgi:hypothetical protein
MSDGTTSQRIINKFHDFYGSQLLPGADGSTNGSTNGSANGSDTGSDGSANGAMSRRASSDFQRMPAYLYRLWGWKVFGQWHGL